MTAPWALALTALLPALANAAEPAPPRSALPPGALQFGSCELPIRWDYDRPKEDLARMMLRWRELRPDRYAPTPLPDKVRLVPDTAPQAELHLVWDEWPGVKPALIDMIRAASAEGTVVLHVRDPDQLPRVRDLIDRLAPPPRSARIAEIPAPESVWLRDFGGHPVTTASGLARIDFRYSVDCPVDDAWPTELGPSLRLPLWVEGGNLLTDGTRCYATDALATDNGLTPEAAARVLASAGCAQTVWLDRVPGTIPHVDPFLALGDPGPDGRPVFALAAVPAELDPETHAALEANAARLAALGTVIRVPVDGARPLPPQLNVQVFNGIVFVPELGDGLTDAILEPLARAWPGRRLVPVPSDGLADLDGGPHCISATVPR